MKKTESGDWKNHGGSGVDVAQFRAIFWPCEQHLSRFALCGEVRANEREQRFYADKKCLLTLIDLDKARYG